MAFNHDDSDDSFDANNSFNDRNTNSDGFAFDVTNDDLAALKAEADTFGEEESMLAERLLRENLPMATMSIIKIARNAQGERTRLDAAKYIVERNLGRLQDINPNAKKMPLEELLNELNDEDFDKIEVAANANAHDESDYPYDKD